MNEDPQKPLEQKTTPNIDDLIAQTTSQAYAFERGKEKASPKQWFASLPKNRKLILVGGSAFATILILILSLSFSSGGNQTLSSKSTTTTSNGTTSSTVSSADNVNSDGSVNETDTTSTDTSVATAGTSWWQKLLSLNNTASTTDNSQSSDTTSSDSSSSSSSDSSSATTASAVAAKENTEDTQADQQTTTPTPTPTTTPSTPTTTTPSTPTTPATSTITLSGVTNFRDAAASSTGLMKTGVLYRSAKLQDATSSDASKLATLLKKGVIVDLRTAKVRKTSPDAKISGVTNLNFPVIGGASASEYVQLFVNNTADRKQFGDAITEIANTKGSVLVHCTAGKDRTGWTVAMIMYALGANDKQVMTEYLKSKEYGAKVDSSWLNAGLSAAKKKNGGSIITYIKSKSAGLGVTDATITKLKAKLSAK